MPASQSNSLWSLTAGYRGLYAKSVAAMAVGTLFLLLVPYVLKWALDALTDGTATVGGTLIPAAIGVVGFNVINGLFTYLRGRWAAQASEGMCETCAIDCSFASNNCLALTTTKPTPATWCNGARRMWKQSAFSWLRKLSKSVVYRCSCSSQFH